MSSGSLLLSNTEYLQNQARFYSDLLESQELTDVTLACDGYQVGAHRTVISASSLFFRDVIKNSKHQNPFIYLKGLSKETLESMLQFIYAGEATVLSENMEKLVEVGNELQIIGLMEIELHNKNNKDQVKYQSSNKPRKEKKKLDSKDTFGKSTVIPKQEKKQEEFIDQKNEEVKGEDNLSIEINKRLLTMKDGNGKTVHLCTVCEKQSKKKDKLKLHIETHLEGFSHKCNYCNLVKKTTANLKVHEYLYHTDPNAKMAQKEAA